MIDIKIVSGRFVTCYPAPSVPEEDKLLEWPQRLKASDAEKRTRHRFQGDRGGTGILDYVLAKADKE